MIVDRVRDVLFSGPVAVPSPASTRRDSAQLLNELEAGGLWEDEDEVIEMVEKRTEERVGVEVDVWQNQVFIGSVAEGTLAERMGLRRGDRIDSVNGTPIVAGAGSGGLGCISSVIAAESPIEALRAAVGGDANRVRFVITRPPVVEVHAADVEFAGADGGWCACHVSLFSDKWIRVDITGYGEADFIDGRELAEVALDSLDDGTRLELRLQLRKGAAFRIRTAADKEAHLRALHLHVLQMSMARTQLDELGPIGAGWLQREPGSDGAGWRPWLWCEAYANGSILYWDAQPRCTLGHAIGSLSLGECAVAPHATKPGTLQLRAGGGERWQLAVAAPLDAARVLHALEECGASKA